MHTDSDEKNLYEKSSTRKVTSKFIMGLLKSRVEKIEKNSNYGQTMVKLIILEY